MVHNLKMMKRLLTAIAIFGFVISSAREKKGSEATSHDAEKTLATAKVMGACGGAKSQQELWVNNVRTIIFTGGDMWWEIGRASCRERV